MDQETTMPEVNIFEALLDDHIANEDFLRPGCQLCSKHACRLTGLYVGRPTEDGLNGKRTLRSEVYIPPNNIFAAFSLDPDYRDFAHYSKAAYTGGNTILMQDVPIKRGKTWYNYNVLCSGPNGIQPHTPITWSMTYLSN